MPDALGRGTDAINRIRIRLFLPADQEHAHSVRALVRALVHTLEHEHDYEEVDAHRQPGQALLAGISRTPALVIQQGTLTLRYHGDFTDALALRRFLGRITRRLAPD